MRYLEVNKEMDYLDREFQNVPFNRNMRISKRQLPSLPFGFKPSFGEPKLGCVGQYRRGLLHAYDMQHYWLIHKDHFNPETHPIEHLVVDAPHWLALGALAIASLFSDE
jgi:hypothetical protein